MDVAERDTRTERVRERGRVARKAGNRRCKQGHEHRIGVVVPEQMLRDAIGDPEGPRQEGPVLVEHGEQVVGAERRVGAEARPHGRRERMTAGELEAKADAGPPARDVVMEVGEQALVAGVDVGRQRDEEDVDVEVGQAEVDHQQAQAEERTRSLRPVGVRLDAGAELRTRGGSRGG